MYHTLTADHLITLREERLQALEADLHRAVLQSEEDPPPAERAAVDARIAELQRRIKVHIDALSPAPPEGKAIDPPPLAEPEPAPTESDATSAELDGELASANGHKRS